VECGSTVLLKEVVTTSGKKGMMPFNVDHPKFWLPTDKTHSIYQFRASAALVPHYDKCRQMIKWKRQGKKDAS